MSENTDYHADEPWVSFCISTYNRPDFLSTQLTSILSQTFTNFEVVISDNDPLESARIVVESFADRRLKYHANGINVGMAKSFNNSIARAVGKHVLLITDDDAIYNHMLADIYKVYERFPEAAIYCGCIRSNRPPNFVEFCNPEQYVFELLHPKITTWLLWSSCIIKREVCVRVGGFPEYGSPHLADHALIVLAGSKEGGVLINARYGHIVLHGGNFSKQHLALYYTGCVEFHKLISSLVPVHLYRRGQENALNLHLHHWFISTFFYLRKYFQFQQPNQQLLSEVRRLSSEIIKLPFMRGARFRYLWKYARFVIKSPLLKLKVLR
jgi:glycosyltransferase involved in cell wall biosynthesis